MHLQRLVDLLDRDQTAEIQFQITGLHLIFSRMHRPVDKKRAVVILRPDDWDEWLTTRNVEAARTMLQLYPVDDMVAEPA